MEYDQCNMMLHGFNSIVAGLWSSPEKESEALSHVYLSLGCCTFIHGGLSVLDLVLHITDIFLFFKLGLQER